jgi:4-amino-4-deoxy-L-arabinose transferase-like glycosyltransferase
MPLSSGCCGGGDDALTSPSRRRAQHPRPPMSDLDWIRVVQVGISTLSVGLVFLLGLDLFDRRSALFAAGVFAFFPEFVGFSHLLFSETLFIALNFVWALLLMRGQRRESASLLAAAGAVLALAALTRQVVASFVFLAVAWLFVMRPSPWRGTARLAAALVLGCVVTLVPWTIRNAVVHGVFAPIAPRSGLALLHGVTGDLQGELGWTAAGGLLPERVIDEHAGKIARERIAANPMGYLRRVVLVNVPNLWAADSHVLRHVQGAAATQPDMVGYPPSPPWLERGLIVLLVASYLALLALAIVGAARAPNWRVTALTVALVLHATAAHALLGANARHRLSLMAFATLYAGYALARPRAERLAPLGTRRTVFLLTSLVLLGLAVSTASYTRLAVQWAQAS